MPGTTIPLPKPLPRLWVTLTARPLASIAARWVVDAPVRPAAAGHRDGPARRLEAGPHLRPQGLGARRAQEPLDGHLHDVGVADVAVRVEPRGPRRLGDEGDVVRAQVVERAQLPAGHAVERLEHLEPAGRRRRGEDLHAPVGHGQRLVPAEPLRVGLEVPAGHHPAEGLHDAVADGAAVDDLDPLAADPPEGGGEVRLAERRCPPPASGRRGDTCGPSRRRDG